jgi:hypothetical protein
MHYKKNVLMIRQSGQILYRSGFVPAGIKGSRAQMGTGNAHEDSFGLGPNAGRDRPGEFLKFRPVQTFATQCYILSSQLTFV